MQLTNPILSLRVARYNDEPLVEPFVVEYGLAGGTIGRAPDCTLVLPDQQRAISRVHARIEFRDGEYLLCDTGGNPSLLNQQLIGGTRKARLANGDRLQIGAYQLEVMIGERAAELYDPLATAKVLVGPSQDESLGIGGGRGGSAALFDPFGQPGFGQPTPASTPQAFQGSQSDHVPPEFEAFAMPRLSDGAAPSLPLSGAGWTGGDFDPLADALARWDAHADQMMEHGAGATLTSGEMMGPSVLPECDMLTMHSKQAPMFLSSTELPSSLLDGPMANGAATPFDELFATVQPTNLDQSQRRASATLSQPSKSDIASPPEAPVNPDQVSSVAATSSDTILAALISGLGLDSSRAPNQLPAEFARLIGALLREALRGTMTVLRSRSTIKREARLDTTMIVARENNPLKFFPDVDSMLAQMLTGCSAGYLSPEQALEQAFVDIQSHELAVIAGMRAALSQLLARFDPAALEAQFGKRSVMDTLLSNRKAKLWDRFVDLQAQLTQESDNDFQKLFGNAFNDAYEAQIDVLHAGRHRPPANSR